MTIRLHRGDLPDLCATGPARLRSTPRPWGSIPTATGCASCSSRPATAPPTWCRSRPARSAPNLKRLLADPAIVKIFHFARFDLGVLFKHLGVMPAPVYCTKIASRLARTYTDRHGLKDLVRELLGIDLSKQQQTLGLGRRGAHRRPGRLCGVRCAASACAEGSSSMPCWRGRGAPNSPRPASASCRTGPGSTSRGWAARTFSPIPELIPKPAWLHASRYRCALGPYGSVGCGPSRSQLSG